MRVSRVWILLIFILSEKCFSQQHDSASDHILQQVPKKYYFEVDGKLNSINSRLTKKSEKALRKMKRQESRLKEMFQHVDSVASNNLFSDAGKEYEQFSQKMSGKVTALTAGSGQYISYLDSLSTSLKFLKKLGGANSKATESLNNLHLLQDKFKQSQHISDYISQRKGQIKNMLSRYTKLPGGLKKQFGKLNKAAYYYSAQVNEYKQMLKDPSKAERKALRLLNKLPAFQKFMQKNSQLATMFRIPDNAGTAQSLAGLQTRASMQGMLQQQIAGGGPNAKQVIQQNMARAQSELNKLKDKIMQRGGGGSDLEMPDFKPNSQKTKSLLQRLEYGANVQFEKSNKNFPSTTNIGLSIGYKLNDKSIVGAGISYKIGMGTIHHIAISQEGIGLRTFADYKLKGSIYMSAGYEMNYNTRFKKIQALKNFNYWQSSGLIGFSRNNKIGKKNIKMQLLWDLMSYKHTPVSPAFVYRMGYKL